MLDTLLPAPHVEHVGSVSRRGTVAMAGLEGELDAVVGEHGVDLVGDGLDQCLQEGAGRGATVKCRREGL